MKKVEKIFLDGTSLSFDTITKVAEDTERKYTVSIKPSAMPAIKASRKYIDMMAARAAKDPNTPYIYGINTGFGANKHNFVDGDSEAKLSRIAYNLIVSHAAGSGEKFPRHVVRAAMLMRANTLVKGRSGIRVEVIQRLLDLLNNDITPVVPCQGSVGGSGDLAPLSHMVLPLMINVYDEKSPLFGKVEYKQKTGDEYKIIEAESVRNLIHPISLKAKEGLALNNGTQFLTAMTGMTAAAGIRLIMASQIAAAMTADSILSTVDAYQPIVHELRKFAGQSKAAANIRKMLKGSTMIFDPSREFDYFIYRQDIEIQKSEIELGLRNELMPVKEPIQDVYSIRCSPQVIGAVLDTVTYVETIVTNEANSVNDNPIINLDFDETRFNGKAVSGGNFHGEPVAFGADFLKIALAELGNVSERRTAALLDPAFNRRLPAFLSPEVSPAGQSEKGMHSGYMIPQYLSAALVAENRILAHPASVDSIPTSAGTEDHVSMGTHGARQAMQIADNVRKILAVELLVAAQALSIRKNQTLEKLYDLEHRERMLNALDGTWNHVKIQPAIDCLADLKKKIMSKKAALKPGSGPEFALRIITAHLENKGLAFPITNDTYLHPYIETMIELLEGGKFIEPMVKKLKLEW